MTALTLNLHPVLELTDGQFYELCQANRNLRLERTATGEIIIRRCGKGNDILLEWINEMSQLQLQSNS